VDDPWASVRRAAADGTSGAAAIASKVLFAVAKMSPNDRAQAMEMMIRAHPSMAPLWHMASFSAKPEDGRFADLWFSLGLRRQLSEQPHLAADLLPKGTIVTISSSSSVAEAIALRPPERVVCMRSEPGGEGQRMAEHISGVTRAEVIDDEAAIAQVPGDMVVMGADAVTPQGLVNKVKTRALAEAARARGVPCLAVAGRAKFVARELPIRPPFEHVPLDLIGMVVDEDRVMSPTEAAAYAQEWDLHPSLLPLLQLLLEENADPSQPVASNGPSPA
jgi:hypothetical protein